MVIFSVNCIVENFLKKFEFIKYFKIDIVVILLDCCIYVMFCIFKLRIKKVVYVKMYVMCSFVLIYGNF